ncbi:MAG: FAD-binding oxidoreductase [Polyangiaceae bacterium]
MSLAGLRSALPDLPVSDETADRLLYGRDAWPRHHFDVREGRVEGRPRPGPAGIAFPRNRDDVRDLVLWARATRTPLVPYGAGSGVTGGILPSADAIVVDTKRMAAIRSLDPSCPAVTVEAGALGSTFEDELAHRGFTLGHFPSSIMCSTVGGWIAARSAGQCSSRFGKIEDMVVSLECVTGAGELVTLPARTRGRSLVPLVVGSEGTLAIVTAATLRIHPKSDVRTFGSFRFRTMEAGWSTMRDAFQAGLRPYALRLYDPFDAMVAKRNGSKGVPDTRQEAIPGPDTRAPRSVGLKDAILRGLLRRPTALNRFLRSERGEAWAGGAMLVAVFEGDDADADLARLRALASERAARESGEGPARHWFRTRHAVSHRMAPIFAGGAFVDTFEVAATWSRLGAVYDAVRLALEPHVFVMAHMSHGYPDGACIYFSFVGSADRSTPSWDGASRARYDRAWAAAMDATIRAGGTIAHHHGVGRAKAHALVTEMGEAVVAFGTLKDAFDPDGILNPGNLGLGRTT